MLALRIKFAIYLFCIGFLIGANFIPKQRIDVAFQKYYNVFIAKIKKRCYNTEYEHPIKVSITFGKVEINDQPTSVAYCEKTQLGIKIVVYKPFWDRINDDLKYTLMFHELSYCYLNQPHSNYINNYMFWQLQPGFTIESVNSQLDDILRTKCTKWSD